ncbi:MAG: hypothetical protein AABW41_04985 [Nanoarchaeota archaeon]
MKNIVILALILFLTIGIANATTNEITEISSSNNENGCNGAIWTTDQSGGTQDKNHYAVGEGVYLNADNFDADEECSWNIQKLSQPPHDIIASGNVNTDSNGQINAYLLYTTQPSDFGSEFKVTLECGRCEKHDNYRVDVGQIPEFSTVAALVALIGSVAVFMIVRKRH